MTDSNVTHLTSDNVVQLSISETQEYFALALKHSAIGMAIIAPDGRWLKVNHALCQFFGYEEDELLAMHFQHLSYPDDQLNDIEYLNRMLNGDIETYTIEKRYVKKTGDIVWGQLTASIVTQSNQQPKCIILQIQDISLQKQVESDQQNQFSDLQHLILTIAHEFNQPMTTFEDLMSLTKRHLDKKQYEQATGLIMFGRRLAGKMRHLSNDLLHYSNIINHSDAQEDAIDFNAIYQDSLLKSKHIFGFQNLSIKFF